MKASRLEEDCSLYFIKKDEDKNRKEEMIQKKNWKICFLGVIGESKAIAK